jgi:hyperosmotically inducible protein
LLRERGIKSTDVKVESNQGRVLLSGFVDSEDQKKRAVNVASGVEGVKEVRDGINVSVETRIRALTPNFPEFSYGWPM